jgi:hypothetical protein
MTQMNNAIDVLILDIQGISGGYSLFPCNYSALGIGEIGNPLNN